MGKLCLWSIAYQSARLLYTYDNYPRTFDSFIISKVIDSGGLHSYSANLGRKLTVKNTSMESNINISNILLANIELRR
jgi:hypothetical protein